MILKESLLLHTRGYEGYAQLLAMSRIDLDSLVLND